jgi:transposase
MSERELNRVEVFSQLSRGGMTAASAAQVLGLSRRQVHRLLERFRSDGPAAIRHRARGRVSNRRIDPAVREFAMTLVGESSLDFGRDRPVSPLWRSSRVTCYAAWAA